jgi:uncharacterized small protein (TIGR04563 family)
MSKKEKPMDDKGKWGSVAFPKDLLEQLRHEAKKQDRSLSWLVRHIAQEYLNSRK